MLSCNRYGMHTLPTIADRLWRVSTDCTASLCRFVIAPVVTPFQPAASAHLQYFLSHVRVRMGEGGGILSWYVCADWNGDSRGRGKQQNKDYQGTRKACSYKDSPLGIMAETQNWEQVWLQTLLVPTVGLLLYQYALHWFSGRKQRIRIYSAVIQYWL